LLEIWAALPADDYGDIVRLLMLTGQRREEIGALRWSEIDLDKGVITLPGERIKNGRDHVIPISDAVRTILQARKRMAGRDLVFGGGQGGFNTFARCKTRLDQSLLDARREAVGAEAQSMPEWRLHDVRRSVATHMAESGIQPHIVEAVLNHISGHKAGVAGIYNRASYEGEKASALAEWAHKLEAIISGKPGKIVPIRSRTA
jgi:integrase